MTEKKKAATAKPRAAARKKSPVYVSELMKKEKAEAAPKAAPSASSNASDNDVYGFVSDGYQSISRTVTELRDAFKKDPVTALQELQIRAIAFLSQKLPTRKTGTDGKTDYRHMRREWIKRRVMQSPPARALKNRLRKKD